MHKILIIIFIFLLTSPLSVFSKSVSRNIYRISIKGYQKIEKAAIESKLLSKKGHPYQKSNISKEVKSIFDMGFFYNVTVDKKITSQGVHLTYLVEEKPSILKISYQGNTEFDDEELAETSGVKIFEILNLSNVQKAIDGIQKLYEDKGYYLANIQYQIHQVEQGKGVHLKFEIKENDQITVKRITFLGNQHLTREELISVMQTKESGFFSFLSSAGSYKKEDFEQDIRRIHLLYFNKGFVRVEIPPPTLTVTPDKREVFITFLINEGEPFYIGDVNFTGDLLFTRKELEETTKTKKGLLFAYDRLQVDLLALQTKYGDKGYAFTNTIPRTQIVEKERLVNVTFDIDKGSKVYLGQINVKGNTKTRDKVVRRELRIHEGKLYNETKKRESINNVKRLGFFEEVNFIQSTPKGALDVVNIDIQVEERQTGSLHVGAGYSDLQGVSLMGQVNQNNLLGRGQRLSVTVNWSQRENIFNIDFTEPYFKDTKWLLGFNVYKTQRHFRTLYDDDRIGGEVRLGYPLGPNLRGIIGYKLDDTQLTLKDDEHRDLFPIETVNGLTSAIELSLVYDKRNDRFMPTGGIYTNFSVEYAGLGGDRKYTRTTTAIRYYKPLFWDIVLRNNLNYGLIFSNIRNTLPPFDELFLLGGANTLRGFDWWTVGKRKFSQRIFDEYKDEYGEEEANRRALRPFGGKQQVYCQIELQRPLIKYSGILGVIFYDVGAAEDSIRFDDFRSNVGFGFRWFSPIGPLRFEWGFPLNRRKDLNENPSVFHFSIGSPF